MKHQCELKQASDRRRTTPYRGTAQMPDESPSRRQDRQEHWRQSRRSRTPPSQQEHRVHKRRPGRDSPPPPLYARQVHRPYSSERHRSRTSSSLHEHQVRRHRSKERYRSRSPSVHRQQPQGSPPGRRGRTRSPSAVSVSSSSSEEPARKRRPPPLEYRPSPGDHWENLKNVYKEDLKKQLQMEAMKELQMERQLHAAQPPAVAQNINYPVHTASYSVQKIHYPVPVPVPVQNPNCPVLVPVQNPNYAGPEGLPHSQGHHQGHQSHQNSHYSGQPQARYAQSDRNLVHPAHITQFPNCQPGQGSVFTSYLCSPPPSPQPPFCVTPPRAKLDTKNRSPPVDEEAPASTRLKTRNAGKWVDRRPDPTTSKQSGGHPGPHQFGPEWVFGETIAWEDRYRPGLIPSPCWGESECSYTESARSSARATVGVPAHQQWRRPPPPLTPMIDRPPWHVLGPRASGEPVLREPANLVDFVAAC